jgi:hypothetical protein
MIVGVSITKRTTWRGIEEEFSNVYHFDAAADVTSKQLVDEVVTAEKAIFGSNVSFVNAKVWGPTDGTKAQSQMLLQEDLTGNGLITPGAVMAKELTAVIQWDTGRKNTRGGRIFYRKYVHLGTINSVDEQAAKGNTQLPNAAVSAIKAYGNKVKNPLAASNAPLTDKMGRTLPLGTDTVVLPHLHTRQFRR